MGKGIDQTPRTMNFVDKDRVQRSAREYLKFILANKNHLRKLRGGDKHIKAAESMGRQKEDLTPNQISYIEGIYEKVWKGAGYESAGTKHDIKKRY